jgi:hypothetical protein
MLLMQARFDSRPQHFFYVYWILHGAVQEDLHGAWVSYLIAFLPFALEFGAHVFVFTRAGFLLPLALYFFAIRA